MRKRPEDHFAFDSKYDFDFRPTTYGRPRADEIEIVRIELRSMTLDTLRTTFPSPDARYSDAISTSTSAAVGQYVSGRQSGSNSSRALDSPSGRI
jgi:hypothetical protein